MHGPLQTGNCPLTIVLVINDVCKMLHMVTYFLGHLSIILLVSTWLQNLLYKIKEKKKTKQQTLCLSSTKATLLPKGILEPQLPGDTILGKHHCKLSLSWSSLGTYSWPLPVGALVYAGMALLMFSQVLFRIIQNVDRQSSCKTQKV